MAEHPEQLVATEIPGLSDSSRERQASFLLEHYVSVHHPQDAAGHRGIPSRDPHCRRPRAEAVLLHQVWLDVRLVVFGAVHVEDQDAAFQESHTGVSAMVQAGLWGSREPVTVLRAGIDQADVAHRRDAFRTSPRS